MPLRNTVEQRSRPPLARMLAIHDALLKDELPNGTKLAEQLETSVKTIGRDVSFMRDQLSLPIEWDAHANGYYYASHVDGFPTVQVTEGELFALLVAQKALEPYRDTPFQAPLESALNKLSDGLKDKVFISLERLDAPVSFKPLGSSQADLTTFQIVARGIAQQQELKFEYCKLGSSKWERRRVQPWHLCCVDGQWYLVTYDTTRKAIRTFSLVRMRNVGILATTFNRPEDFDIHDHLRNAFGIFGGKTRLRVRVEFDSWAARLIQEKQWHPTQKTKETADGGLRFEVEVASLFEIERWILSWGSHVKVISPKRLRESVKKHAAAILEAD